MRFPVWQRLSKVRREVICQERRAFKPQARQIISTNWAHNCHTHTHTHTHAHTHAHTANRSALNTTCGLVGRERHYFRPITLPVLCSEVWNISNSVWQLEPWQLWRFVTLLDSTRCMNLDVLCIFQYKYLLMFRKPAISARRKAVNNVWQRATNVIAGWFAERTSKISITGVPNSPTAEIFV